MSQITHIRKAEQADYNSLCQLQRDVVQAMLEAKLNLWTEDYPTVDQMHADVSAGNVWLMTLEEKVVAMVVLDFNQHPSYAELTWRTPQKSLVLHRLMVHPEFQGRGLAAKMLEFAEEQAVAHGGLRLDTGIEHETMKHFLIKHDYDLRGQVFFEGWPKAFLCFEKLC